MYGNSAAQRLAEFYSALTRSEPSKAARNRKDVSFAKPDVYLQLTRKDMPQGSPPPTPPAINPRLLRLLELQHEDGKWEESEELVEVLGGMLPDPPGGVVEWRWVTIVCLAFIRRYPEFYEATAEASSKALDWVTDYSLIEKARQALPPPLPYYVDPAAIKERRWLVEAQSMVEKGGYLALGGEPQWASTDRFRSLDGTTLRVGDEIPVSARKATLSIRKEKAKEEAPFSVAVIEKAKQILSEEVRNEFKTAPPSVRRRMESTVRQLGVESELIKEWQHDDKVRNTHTTQSCLVPFQASGTLPLPPPSSTCMSTY